MLSEPHPWNGGCHIMPTYVGKGYSALGPLTDHHVSPAPRIAVSETFRDSHMYPESDRSLYRVYIYGLSWSLSHLQTATLPYGSTQRCQGHRSVAPAPYIALSASPELRFGADVSPKVTPYRVAP